jgi:MinD-like ATPase involved in chromosome partitioning or flagellar assembly
MTYLTIAERLLTWLDVERVLKQQTELWSKLPTGIHSVDCFADGMDISHSVTPDVINNWLKSVFEHAYDINRGVIKLRIAESEYPISFLLEPKQERVKSQPTYPLWRDVTYLKDTLADDSTLPQGLKSKIASPTSWIDGPQMVSFHSFKGGVGRTTALMTYVAACLQEVSSTPKKILVIDADLEAPGVSFWLDEINRPKVSFVQFLEAMHYPPISVESSLDFFATELQKTSINVMGSQRELFVLPAALELTEIQDMPVQPEHLARNPENPWVLTDHLHSLGKLLGVDAVFIDLRAGLSELASPILFDPRIDHFFVSTVATQSVTGMAEILKRLHAFNGQLDATLRDQAKPSLILSLLTKELRNASVYQQALNMLGQAYPPSSDDALSGGLEWLEAEFMSSLMSISSIREALETLKHSAVLYAAARDWAKTICAPLQLTNAATCGNNESQSDRQVSANALFEICEQAQFAESDLVSSMLATEPLRNLGKHYSKELPNLVIVGAKGAGKTFTFRQIVSAQRWPEFLSKVGFQPSAVTDAYIFPVLWSANIIDKPNGEIKKSQHFCLSELGLEIQNALTASDVAREINVALKFPPAHWDEFWDHLVCRQFGIADADLRALNNKLESLKKPVILAFDGIEDAFEDPTKDGARDAIHALLKLPNRLSELTDLRLGAIIFVRADYVQSAIRQNQGQFLQRYLAFQLQWNPESFLRLAYWLCCKAGIFTVDPIEAEHLQPQDLKDRLEQLWGRKLGSEKSKEAHSSRWVYAALCDLRGNIQARDLVRFLKFTAKNESGRPSDSWPSRVLSPESMRKAIPQCSVEKVEEAQKEIAPLREWMLQLKTNSVTVRKVPFSASAMFLTPEMLNSLQEIGIIYEDLDGALGEERLFLPEIYRSGLGFETSTGGRPRMQALLKKNLGSIPL